MDAALPMAWVALPPRATGAESLLSYSHFLFRARGDCFVHVKICELLEANRDYIEFWLVLISSLIVSRRRRIKIRFEMELSESSAFFLFLRRSDRL